MTRLPVRRPVITRGRRLVALVALVVVGTSACGGQPSVAPAGLASGAPAATGLPAASSDASSIALKNAALALAGQNLGTPDVIRDELDTAMGLRASLGTDADQILALAHASEDVARAQTPVPLAPPSAAPSAAPSAGAFVNGIVLAAFKPPTTPPPGIELRAGLAAILDGIGRPGGKAVHDGPTAASATASDGGLTGTTQMTTTIDGLIEGSKVTVTIQRDSHSVVTDATGATIFDQTRSYTAVASIDGCPSAAGLATGSLDNTAVSEASTVAGAGGRVGSHATDKLTSDSTFKGQVDDLATLGGVSQDYTRHEEWNRTASAAGGPESTSAGAFGVDAAGIQGGVPAAQDAFMAGDWSGATSSTTSSGDATPQMDRNTVLSAAYDYSIIVPAYVAAERLWRHGRCVMIAVPEYNAETGLDGTNSNTQEVAKGSSTPFQVTLKHRFGASVSASIEAELSSGKESLTPGSIPKSPGTLTYVAPNEDGKDAVVSMKSTSKQGIGTLTLTLHTGGGWVTDNTSPDSTLKGQKCSGLGGEWLLQGVVNGGGMDQTVTFRVMIDSQTLLGTYSYKSIASIPSGTGTVVGTGPASIVVQADRSVVMTLGATSAKSTMTIAGNTQSFTLPLPGWTFTWTPGGSCPAA
jgi:hypothetical protein